MLVVVARIGKGVFDSALLSVLGKELSVRSVVKVLKKGAMVRFTQQLLTGEGTVAASAEVTPTPATHEHRQRLKAGGTCVPGTSW